MARLPRLVVAGLPHLVSQRAHHGQAMVHDDDDLAALIDLLRSTAAQLGVAVHAYGLVDDRFDLVATPQRPQDLALWMQAVGRRHAAQFNRRHARSGSLWGGRFRTAVIEPAAWLLHCMVWTEQLASHGASGGMEPDWSSRLHHCGERRAPWLNDPPAYWALGNTPFEREAQYRARVANPLTPIQISRIDAALRGGWALGSDAFAAGLANDGARAPLPRRRGRPRMSPDV